MAPVSMGQGWSDFGVNEQWPKRSLVVMHEFSWQHMATPWDLQYKNQVAYWSLTSLPKTFTIVFHNWDHRLNGTNLVACQLWAVIAIWKQRLSIQCQFCKNNWPRYHQLDALSSPAVCGETKFVGILSIVREYQTCACKYLLVDIWLLLWVKTDKMCHMILKLKCIMQRVSIYIETRNNVRER